MKVKIPKRPKAFKNISIIIRSYITQLCSNFVHHLKNWKRNLSHSPSTALSLFKDKLLLMDMNGCTIYTKRNMENPLEMK
ncbi:hypothetical protein ABEB36_011296 [Hypothenemus hampei]|uniref:Uncharacterized protein n=1 Tax=Hypothenemus hampei TaxID=57062 RepID=A0ABD1EJ40_HYPHA